MKLSQRTLEIALDLLANFRMSPLEEQAAERFLMGVEAGRELQLALQELRQESTTDNQGTDPSDQAGEEG